MEPVAEERVILSHGPTPVRWRRSVRARRVSLRIDRRCGSVIVTLPPRATRAAGMALLIGHAVWVAERLAALPASIPFAAGALVPLHGALHRIVHDPARRGTVRVQDGHILVSGDPDLLARRVAGFLRAEARGALSTQVMAKSTLLGIMPTRITVKDTSSRWGSCTATRALAFSWRLVMAPAAVQDYVVAHEVAHLRHMNHSPRFWAVVAELTPHTETATRWLRAEGPGLMRVG